jgi:hypothetical protein
MAHVTMQDLEAALGTSVYTAIFGDHGQDAADVQAVNIVLRMARADVMRHVLFGYDGEPPDVSDELWAIELDFAVARSFLRGDVAMRENGSALLELAKSNAKDVATGMQRGHNEQPNPSQALAPETAVPDPFVAVPVEFGPPVEEG